MQLEPMSEVVLGRLGLDETALDGPFVMRDGRFGLLVSLRGKDGGAMPSPAALLWRRDVPARLRTEDVQVFCRRGASATYLGAARFLRTGGPSRDGSKVLFVLHEPLDEALWRELVDAASAPPPPAPEEAIASLSSSSTVEERVSAMLVFVERWFDCNPDGAPIAARETVPAALHALHGVTGDREVCVQNHLLKADALVSEDGKTIFYEESQGVCSWAFEQGGDDPAVFVRQNDHGAPWKREAASLSAFLIEVLVYEAVLGAPFSASHDGIHPRDLKKLSRLVAPLPLPPWESSKTRFFGSNGVIGFAEPDGDRVWLGAKDRTRLEPLEELVADWENVGF